MKIRPVAIGLFLILSTVAGIILTRRPPQAVPAPQVPTISNRISPTKPAQPESQGPVPDIPFSLPAGFTVHVFASGLGNPRVLAFTPGGTLLVSDPAANTVTALPDADGNGVADSEKVVIRGRDNVHGLAFYGGRLFVAEATRVVRYVWDEPSLSAGEDKVLFPLPANRDHNKRTLAFDARGRLYISLGSTCDFCTEPATTGGSVLVSDADGSPPLVFATGLRNAAFLAFNPGTGELWGTEMGRDHLGDDLPPDEINIIRLGNDYGWPSCYGDRIQDSGFAPGPYRCGPTAKPVYDIPAHSAPLGLAFISSRQFPADWQGDLLVAYHGSWNRTVPAGYKVVRLKVSGNTVTGSEDFLTGFAGGTYASVRGRPVGLVFDIAGDLFISDDKAGAVYIVQKRPAQ